MISTASTKSVAILVDHLYNYQVSVLAGIRSHLKGHGIPSLVYLGRELNTSRTSWLKANDLYTRIDVGNHLGVIALSAALSTHTTPDDFLAFFQQYALPKVSVGMTLPGIPSILADNVTGMQAMMEHLIQARGFRRFVFVRGIENNVDSQERESVFRASLERYGLSVVPDFMLSGKFHSTLAHQEMSRLLSRRQDFDVVVSCNDEMTEGIVQALTERRLRVPEDVAVVGFDDSEDFRYVIPALTTVRQPIFEQAQKAAEQLLKQLSRQESAPVTAVPTQLVVRQSCGQPAQVQVHPSSEVQGQLRAEFLRCGPVPGEHATFLSRWKHLILSEVRAQRQIHTWQDWLAGVRQAPPPGLTPEQKRALDDLCFELQKLIIQAQQMVLNRQRLLMAFEADTKWHLDMALMSQQDYAGLYEQIRLYLKTLNLSRFFLVAYETFGPEPAPFARVATAEGTAAALDSGVFPARELLPVSMREELGQGHLVMTALFSGEQHFGYLLFEQPETLNFVEEGFRQAISWAFYRLSQAKALQAYTEGLEQQVSFRTKQLQEEIRERKYAEQALQSANAELQRYAYQDSLTALDNRAAFEDQLSRIWQDHQQTQSACGMLLCDVDFFKLYNDHYGHLQGDECLKAVAALLKKSVRIPGDVVARYGGEEFVLVLPQSSLAEVLVVADRIHQNLREAAFPHAMSPVNQRVTISIGAASMVPTKTSSPVRLLGEVDQLLYQSKHLGRSRTSWQRTAAESLEEIPLPGRSGV